MNPDDVLSRSTLAPVRTFPDPAALAQEGALLVTKALAEAIERRGRASIALSGGSTPQALYRRILEDPALRAAVDWASVEWFWGDERWVGPEDERSNAHMARLNLLDHLPGVLGERVHPMPTLTAEPADAARLYEAELRRVLCEDADGQGVPRLDLVLMGLGDNAHTASLFPGQVAEAVAAGGRGPWSRPCTSAK